MVVHYLPGGQRIGQALVKRIAPHTRGRIERVGAVPLARLAGGLEMVLATVDVVDRQLTRRGRIARRAVGDPASLNDRGVLTGRCCERRGIVGACKLHGRRCPTQRAIPEGSRK